MQRKPPPDHSIRKLQAYEEKLNNLRSNVQDARRKEQAAVWETKATVKAQRGVASLRMEEMQWHADQDLARRRASLRDKLAAEDAALRSELTAGKETADERRAKLAQKAQGLAQKREEARKAQADALLTRAFRDAYDPIRTDDSRTKTLRAAEDRKHQRVEMAQRREAAKAEAAAHDAAFAAYADKMEQRYRDDKAKEKRANDEMTAILDEQVVQYRNRLAEEEAQRLEEVAAMKADWARQDREAEEKAQALREAEERRVRAVAAFNEQKRQMDKAILDKEEAEDLEYLRLAMEQAAHDAEKARREKETKQRQMAEYQRQLQELMVKEAEDTAEQDRLIEEQNRLQQAKYDAVKQAEEDARQALLHEVVETRAQQLAWKYDMEMYEMEERRREAERHAEESAQLAEIEETTRHRLRQARLGAQQELLDQMELKKERLAAEAAEDAAADKMMADDRIRYGAMIKKIEGTEPPTWYGRRKIDWMS